MIDVADDTAKLLRILADRNGTGDFKIAVLEAARRCDAVADFVTDVNRGHSIQIAAERLLNKLVNNT